MQPLRGAALIGDLELLTIVEHLSSREEIEDLLGVVERDLHDATTSGLSADWKFGIAYNAILQCAMVAFAVC